MSLIEQDLSPSIDSSSGLLNLEVYWSKGACLGSLLKIWIRYFAPLDRKFECHQNAINICIYELYYHVPKGGLEEEGKIDLSKRTVIRSIEVVCVPHEKWKMRGRIGLALTATVCKSHRKFVGALEIKAFQKEDLEH
jgi:hypothetical protein